MSSFDLSEWKFQQLTVTHVCMRMCVRACVCAYVSIDEFERIMESKWKIPGCPAEKGPWSKIPRISGKGNVY